MTVHNQYFLKLSFTKVFHRFSAISIRILLGWNGYPLQHTNDIFHRDKINKTKMYIGV